MADDRAARGTYDWERADALLQALRQAGLTPLVSIWGTPRWANGGRGAERRRRARRATFATFARGRGGAVPVGASLDRLERAEPAALAHAAVADRLRHAAAQPGGGGDQGASSRGRRSPAARPRPAVAAAARRRSTSSAAWAAPAPGSMRTRTIRTRSRRRRRRRPAGCAHCSTISMATLDRLLHGDAVAPSAPRTASGSRSSATRRTRPTGCSASAGGRRRGSSPRPSTARTARPASTSSIQYLLRDEPRLDAWQSGLETVSGRAKPALAAFSLPLVQVVGGRRDDGLGSGPAGDGRSAVRPPAARRAQVGEHRRRADDDPRVLHAHVRAEKGTVLRLFDPATGRVGRRSSSSSRRVRSGRGPGRLHDATAPTQRPAEAASAARRAPDRRRRARRKSSRNVIAHYRAHEAELPAETRDRHRPALARRHPRRRPGAATLRRSPRSGRSQRASRGAAATTRCSASARCASTGSRHAAGSDSRATSSPDWNHDHVVVEALARRPLGAVRSRADVPGDFAVRHARHARPAPRHAVRDRRRGLARPSRGTARRRRRTVSIPTCPSVRARWFVRDVRDHGARAPDEGRAAPLGRLGRDGT